jgi:hypothetical protein
MTGSLAGLVAANVLYLAIGAGLLPLLHVARSWSSLLLRLGLAYLVGVTVAGILVAHLALLDLALGLPELFGLAALSLALGVGTLVYRGEPSLLTLPRPRLAWIVTGGSLIATVVLLVRAGQSFAVRPLLEWDGWASWAMKARALYEVGGGLDSPALTSQFQLAYPLFFPAFEATGFRAMGAFDGTLIHVQLIALAFGFAVALWGLLADRVPGVILGPTILAIVAASPLLAQLSTNYADVPLAFFVALGTVSFARSLVTGEGWPLAVGALFFGAALLTKNEAAVFAVAAGVALLVALAPRRRLFTRVGLAFLGMAAVVFPWRLFLALHDLQDVPDGSASAFDPSYLSANTDRVEPAASALWQEATRGDWGYLLPLGAAGLAIALLARRFALASFAFVWAGLAFLGLVLVYWSSREPLGEYLHFSAYRVVVPFVVGSAALAALLAGEALTMWSRPAPAQAEPVAERRHPAAAELLERT